MKSSKLLSILIILVTTGFLSGIYAQTNELQFTTNPGKASWGVFEVSKADLTPYNGLNIKVGGDFALQFQGISQTNSGDSLGALANNFNLPTANLNIDVQLEDGVKMHLRTYLSSRHHTEAYVKGGYMQIDKLDFIQEGLFEELMKSLRIRVGMDQINYGDAQFRRSDNAAAILNPFVGNYLMDSFTTEPFMEISYLNNGIIGLVGATNGRLNQSPTPGDDGFVVFAKAGYDSQINQDLRVRLTASIYNSNDKGTRDYIYGGDRAGARYYKVLDGGDFSGRFNPRYAYQNAVQINPYLVYQGLEFFGIVELVSNGDTEVGGGFTHLGAELLYHLGAERNAYVGGRFNSVSGEQTDASASSEISRLNLGAGWFMTDNVLTKVEYVNQSYSGAAFDGGMFQGAEFSGLMIEAVISF